MPDPHPRGKGSLLPLAVPFSLCYNELKQRHKTNRNGIARPQKAADDTSIA